MMNSHGHDQIKATQGCPIQAKRYQHNYAISRGVVIVFFFDNENPITQCLSFAQMIRPENKF